MTHNTVSDALSASIHEQDKRIHVLESERDELKQENIEYRKWKAKLQKFGSMLLQPREDGFELIGHRKFRDAFADLLREHIRDPSTLMAEGAQEERLQALESECDSLRRELEEAREYLNGLLWFLDVGALVRNTEHDGRPDWVIGASEWTLWLARAARCAEGNTAREGENK